MPTTPATNKVTLTGFQIAAFAIRERGEQQDSSVRAPLPHAPVRPKEIDQTEIVNSYFPPSSVSRCHVGRRLLRGTDMDVSSFLRKGPLNKLLAPNHTQ